MGLLFEIKSQIIEFIVKESDDLTVSKTFYMYGRIIQILDEISCISLCLHNNHIIVMLFTY